MIKVMMRRMMLKMSRVLWCETLVEDDDDGDDQKISIDKWYKFLIDISFNLKGNHGNRSKSKNDDVDDDWER